MWRPGVILVLAFGLVAFGRADTKTAGVVSPTQQPLGSEYNYQNYPYYQQYYPNYQYSGYNGVQKQDSGLNLGNLFNFGTDSGSGFQGGNNGGGFGGGSDDGSLSAMGSAAASVAAAIGIKGLLKVVFGALGIFVLLWLIPLALSIAAIVLATENNGGGDGGAGGIADKMKDMMGFNKGNRNVGRAMEALNQVFSSEQCIERISCSISRRAFGARKLSKKTAAQSIEQTAQTVPAGKGRSKGEETKPEGPNRRDNSLMGRISRGLKSENCEAYQCRIASYFS